MAWGQLRQSLWAIISVPDRCVHSILDSSKRSISGSSSVVLQMASTMARVFHIAAVIGLLLTWSTSASVAHAQSPIDSARITIAVEATGAVDAASLEVSVRPVIDTALSELSSLLDIQPTLPLGIRFGAIPDRSSQQRLQNVDDVAWIDPAAAVAIIDLNRYLQLSPAESGNVLRNLLSRLVVFEVSGGALPAGLNNGIASYFERPILAEQARRGSLVQQIDIAGEIPNLTSLVNSTPTLLEAETETSLHYAFSAFLADHYGVSTLQQVVVQSASATNWQMILTGATGQSIEQMTTAWDQFLPRWFSGGWQFNAINGFDLAVAQGLFDRGAYSSAISVAEDSQALFTELGDPVRLAEIEKFISLNAIGVRAEQLMKETQTSLEAYDYVNAQSKLDQAEAQYAYLPPTHRPASLIDTWRETIGTGLAANSTSIDALSISSNWSKTRESRDLAIRAGNLYASIGNEAGASENQTLVSDLNLRLQRITLAATGAVILVAVWLLMWLWARTPNRFLWHDRRHLMLDLGRGR